MIIHRRWSIRSYPPVHLRIVKLSTFPIFVLKLLSFIKFNPFSYEISIFQNVPFLEMSLFNKKMAADLAKLVEENQDELYPAKGTPNSRDVSNNAWARIADQMNAVYRSNLTVKNFRDKVTEMKRSTKKELSDEKK